MKKMILALIVGCCFAVMSAGAAFAAEDPIVQKQQEIDQYVFEQHSADFEKKGITITHTAPQNGYVEIGITPFNEANADYVYGIFGKDAVKVVKGEQAVTLDTASAAGTTATTATITQAAPAPATTAASTAASSSPSAILYASAGLIVLGAVVFALRKLQLAKR